MSNDEALAVVRMAPMMGLTAMMALGGGDLAEKKGIMSMMMMTTTINVDGDDIDGETKKGKKGRRGR